MANISTETLDKTNGAAREFKNQVQNVEHRLEKMSHEAIETSRDYIEENPGKSVAIAAAAGLVVGSLLTLALRRR